MSISVESARKKIKDKYNIDVEVYTSDETVDEISDKIEDIFSFGLYFFLPIILSGLISLIVSIFLGFSENFKLGILCFVCTIPIWLIFVGSFSYIFALRSFVIGIIHLINYSINITNDIHKKLVKQQIKHTYKDITMLVSYAIVFPIFKKCLRNSIINEILYFFVEKIVKFCNNKISKEADSANLNEIEPFEKSNNKNFDKITMIINVILNTISIIIGIIGTLSLILGIIFLFIFII